MKGIVLAAPVFLLSLILALGNMGGCTDSTCDLILNSILNGSSINDQTSEWDCKRGGETVFTLALFGDMTGTRSDIGDFVYDRTECRRIVFENADGTGKLTGLDGDSRTGLLSFEQVSDDFGDITVACDFVEF